ncbi:hypothetical protein [Mucilaginibacter myungsuensis]|uniref:Lipoprotein n=1 Tax=Mucilaginibacter myungsuensis TaxID=649104 RepID=A0A929PWS6_9SPHI|nr:hypothetical protein [Mucilaginibacter myungsuensis]MBE9661492.1 hypothetical protein [Mucilaginibacter myungsuensis]MDN3597635.1 hypothetical protein [Mucilaginibacter myungsuensis]
MQKASYLLLIPVMLIAIIGCGSSEHRNANDTIAVINRIFEHQNLGKELLGDPDTILILKPEKKLRNSWPERIHKWPVRYVDPTPAMYISNPSAKGYQKLYRFGFRKFIIQGDSATVEVDFFNAGSVDIFHLKKSERTWNVYAHTFKIH